MRVQGVSLSSVKKGTPKGQPIAANRTQALLSKMFRFGVGRDIVPYSPCIEITKSAPEHKKDRVLSDDEIEDDVWTIPAENAKNKEAHCVPFSPQALALLDMVKNVSP